MSKGLNIELTGIDNLIKKLEGNALEMTDRIDKSMNYSIAEINEIQQKYTPVDTGELKRHNRFDGSKKLDKLIFNDLEYSPFVEFGTGGLVDVPAGLEEIAIQFKGTTGRKVNLPARPFFFRAFFENKSKLIENIKKEIYK